MMRFRLNWIVRLSMAIVVISVGSGAANANEASWTGPASSMLDGAGPPAMTCGSINGCHGSGNNNTGFARSSVPSLEIPAGATTFTLTGSQMGIPSSNSWALRYKVNGTKSATYVKDNDSTERVITVPATGTATFDYCVGDYNPSTNSARNLHCSSFNVTHAAVGTIAFSRSSYTGSESAGEAVVSLTRSGGSSGAVTATVTATPGTASSADFGGTSFNVTWPNGVADTRTITIPIVNDTLFEGTESFSLRISSVNNGATISSSSRSATVNITDNDPAPVVGTVALTASSYTGSEDSRVARISLSRTIGTSGSVAATVTATPASASTADYTGSTFTVDWNNGQSGTRNIDIPIVDDALFEGTESFTVTITNATGGATINSSANTARVNITDNDSEPEPGVLSLTAASYDGSEDDGEALITLRRTGGSDGAVSATVTATAGTASTSDFTGTRFTADWRDGQSGTQTVRIPIVDDGDVEGSENFTVTISSTSGGATFDSGDDATVTILDNDEAEPEPTPGAIALAANNYDTSEDDGEALITLRRSGGSDGAVSATVTATAGTASSSDFTGTTFTADWRDGQSGTQTIRIPIVDDGDVEGSENFTVTISSTSGGATFDSDDDATVTILDNDEAEPEPTPGTVALTATSYETSEDDGEALITLRRNSGSDGAISVTVTATAGTASSDDFTGTTFTADWRDGQSGTQTIRIPIVDDGDVEESETFRVEITNVSSGVSVGSNDGATVTILDNDEEEVEASPGVVSFSGNAVSVSESDGSVSVTLRRSAGTDGAISARVDTTNGTAGTEDYSAGSYTADWEDGQTGIQTIVIGIVNDDAVETSETFSLQLSSVSGGGSVGSTDSIVVTINDDDAEEPPVVEPPTVTNPLPIEPPTSSACTAFARSLVAAKRAYAASCTLPRVDCDPMDGGWLCSSEQIGSGKPPQAVDVSEEQGEACVAMGATLAVAKRNYANSCSQRRRDCDPVDGQWMCSSQVIGDNAPALFASVSSPANTVTRETGTESAACACMNDTNWAEAFLGSVTTGEFGRSMIDKTTGEVDVTVYRGAEQSLLSVNYDDQSNVASCIIGRAENGILRAEQISMQTASYDDALRCADLLVEDSVPQPGWLRVTHRLQIAPVDQISNVALTINGQALFYPESYRVADLLLDEVMSVADLVYVSADACYTDGNPLGVIVTSEVDSVIDDPDFLPEAASAGSNSMQYQTCAGSLIGEFSFPSETWIPFARNGGQILQGSRLTD